jgi:rfaE bifunctional protein kinase chain/domain/rfaE bifunctional protein nucleotidyltransferase chain/domain
LPILEHNNGTAPAARAKIKTLAELAKILEGLRAKKKKVAHCHGVFDLLHIGHIRHFEEARALGDVLVVTLTPDPYVNKGPSRPVFTQDLRAEAIASLDCVDYVAINEWPTAVETVKKLKPSLYVKGPDYEDAQKDLTGGIDLERRAVEAAGGKLAITRGITFSSSNLINRYMAVLPKPTVDYLSDLARRHPTREVLGYLEGAARQKVLVIGESIIDEYNYVVAIGKSSKEPMLAVKYLSTEKFAGGILAVANHVSAFARETAVLSYLGETDSQEAFIRKSLRPEIKPHFFHKKGAPTIVKRRIIDQYFFTKLLAVYEMNDGPLTPGDNKHLCDWLKKHVADYDVVIVVDFGHGMMTPEAIDILRKKAKFLAVNTQSNAGNQGYHTVSQYKRADYISMADNEFRLEARDRHKDIKEIVIRLSKKMRCPNIVVTGGKAGCMAYNAKQGFVQVPAFAVKVVDRMGAGDAFLSLTAPCVAQGAPMEVAAFIGNVAGSEAVATVGHRSSIEKISLFKHIETLLK